MKSVINFIRYDIPNGIKNLVRFLPVVWRYREWDYNYTLDLLLHGLIGLENAIRNGVEVDEHRIPKADKIARVVEILNHIVNNEYIEIAESELGSLSEIESFETYKATDHDMKVFKRIEEMEQNEWIELWSIIQGDGEKGSNMLGWWD